MTTTTMGKINSFIFPPVLRFKSTILYGFGISTDRTWWKKNVADMSGPENSADRIDQVPLRRRNDIYDIHF